MPTCPPDVSKPATTKATFHALQSCPARPSSTCFSFPFPPPFPQLAFPCPPSPHTGGAGGEASCHGAPGERVGGGIPTAHDTPIFGRPPCCPPCTLTLTLYTPVHSTHCTTSNTWPLPRLCPPAITLSHPLLPFHLSSPPLPPPGVFLARGAVRRSGCAGPHHPHPLCAWLASQGRAGGGEGGEGGTRESRGKKGLVQT